MVTCSFMFALKMFLVRRNLGKVRMFYVGPIKIRIEMADKTKSVMLLFCFVGSLFLHGHDWLLFRGLARCVFHSL